MAEEVKKTAEEKTPQAEVKKVEENKVEDSKYVPGRYRSSKPIRVLKALTHADKKNSDGTIARTFGTWARPENFYYFSDKQSVELTKEDLKHASIRDMIDNGTLFRVLQ